MLLVVLAEVTLEKRCADPECQANHDIPCIVHAEAELFELEQRQVHMDCTIHRLVTQTTPSVLLDANSIGDDNQRRVREAVAGAIAEILEQVHPHLKDRGELEVIEMDDGTCVISAGASN